MTKNTHGGKRKNAGRKPTHGERKQMASMRLTPTLLRYLAQCDGSMAETVEDTLRRSAGFKRWQA